MVFFSILWVKKGPSHVSRNIRFCTLVAELSPSNLEVPKSGAAGEKKADVVEHL